MWVGLKIICLVPKMVASISFVFPSVPLKSFSCHFLNLALNSTVVDVIVCCYIYVVVIYCVYSMCFMYYLYVNCSI